MVFFFSSGHIGSKHINEYKDFDHCKFMNFLL
jgi:hypothetical protein